MKSRLNKRVLGYGLGAMLVLPVAAFANLVTDGDFTLAGTPSGYATYNTGSTMGGWSVTSGSVDLIGTYWQAPPSGGNSVDMAGNSSGTISQTINALTAGQNYALSFYLSGNPDGPPATKQLDVTIGALTLPFYYTVGANNRSPSPMNYVLETAYFTATTPSELLQLQDLSNGSGVNNPTGQPGTPWGAVVGGVSITAVPEPTTMVAGALLLVPFGMSTLRMLRKSRAA